MKSKIERYPLKIKKSISFVRKNKDLLISSCIFLVAKKFLALVFKVAIIAPKQCINGYPGSTICCSIEALSYFHDYISARKSRIVNIFVIPKYSLSVPYNKLLNQLARNVRVDSLLSLRIFNGEELIPKNSSALKAKQNLNPQKVLLYLSNSGEWDSNYFHWFIDFATILLIFTESTKRSNYETYYLTSRQLLSVKRITLKALGLDPAKICHEIIPGIDAFGLAQNRLLINSPYDLLDADTINKLSLIIVSYARARALNIRTSPKRLLISRRDATCRRLLNEEELYDQILKELGFVVVTLTDLEFVNQVNLFSSAEVVISPHGAGLTNLLWSHRCSVLEVASIAHGVRPDYFQISLIRENNYHLYVDHEYRCLSDVVLPKAYLKKFLKQVSII